MKTQWTPHSWRASITCKLEEMFIVFKSVSMGRERGGVDNVKSGLALF